MDKKEFDQKCCEKPTKADSVEQRNQLCPLRSACLYYHKLRLRLKTYCSPIVSFHNRAYAKPRPWGARIGCYIWYALNMYLVSCVFVSILPHSTLTLKDHELGAVLSKAIELFEALSPGSSGPLVSMIPKRWSSVSTRYEFFFDEICREVEGNKRMCYDAEGEKMMTAIIKDIGVQIAEKNNDSGFSSRWSKALHLALEAAVRDIKPYLIYRQASSDSGAFAKDFYFESKGGSTAGWVMTHFICFVIGLLLDAVSYFLTANDMPLAFGKTLVYGIQAFLWFAFQSEERQRHVGLGLDFKSGGFCSLVILCSIWHFVHYFSLVWYYGPKEWRAELDV